MPSAVQLITQMDKKARSKMKFEHLPEKQGLYDPRSERDSCGVGFVCDIKGRRSHDTVSKGILALEHLMHRGATGSDPKTGDGAGVLIQVPHEFLSKECSKTGIRLPKAGDYGVGLVFLPTDSKERKFCEENLKEIIEGEGLVFLGWREVPVDDSMIGKTARETEPVIRHLFVGKTAAAADELAFERKLYVVRKRAENLVRASKIRQI